MSELICTDDSSSETEHGDTSRRTTEGAASDCYIEDQPSETVQNAGDKEEEQRRKCNIVVRYNEEKSHVVKYVAAHQAGLRGVLAKDIIINGIKQMRIYSRVVPRSYSITNMVWHPQQPETFALGFSYGKLVIGNWSHMSTRFPHNMIVTHLGQHKIDAMKFDRVNEEQIYVANGEGNIVLYNFHTNQKTFSLETGNLFMYSSLDVSHTGDKAVAGDYRGNITLTDGVGNLQCTYKLHDTKITHCELDKRYSSHLVTSSLDFSVKLWDLRYMAATPIPYHVFPHDFPVNVATFSSTDGCRLLTNDQGYQINVFRGPMWHRETQIWQPIRHLRTVRAAWHPLVDLIVIGGNLNPWSRAPQWVCQKQIRTVDFFDAASGCLLHQFTESDCIPSINKFNVDGKRLATGYGIDIMFRRMGDWSCNTLFEEEKKNVNVIYVKTYVV